MSFEEAAHLLWRGALPSREESATLRKEIAALRALPEEAMRVVRAAADAPPIDALRMACATLSLDLDNPDDISPAADMQAAKMLTAVHVRPPDVTTSVPSAILVATTALAACLVPARRASHVDPMTTLRNE